MRWFGVSLLRTSALNVSPACSAAAAAAGGGGAHPDDTGADKPDTPLFAADETERSSESGGAGATVVNVASGVVRLQRLDSFSFTRAPAAGTHPGLCATRAASSSYKLLA